MADEDIDTDTDTPPADASATDATDRADGTEALGDAGKQALDRMKAERDDAKRQFKATQKELADFRKASMTEAERAVAEAEERGRMTAVTTYGQRLARTTYIAEAAKRNPTYDAGAVFDDLNLAKFLGEDGEPDSKAIAASVQRLIPAVDAGPPSFDGGARKSAGPAGDMNTLIRRQAGYQR